VKTIFEIVKYSATLLDYFAISPFCHKCRL